MLIKKRCTADEKKIGWAGKSLRAGTKNESRRHMNAVHITRGRSIFQRKKRIKMREAKRWNGEEGWLKMQLN